MSRSSAVFGSIVAAALLIASARAEDCESEGLAQSHDLATFSAMVGIRNCEAPEGRADYARHVALLTIMTQRDQRLASLCANADERSRARWDYVRKTLEIQSRVFGRVSAGCAR